MELAVLSSEEVVAVGMAVAGTVAAAVVVVVAAALVGNNSVDMGKGESTVVVRHKGVFAGAAAAAFVELHSWVENIRS